MVAILIIAIALPAFAQTKLENPLKVPDLNKFVEGVLRAIVIIALPVITVFIVYAGFKYISARGNPGEITKAHENFKWVVIGAALILGAWVLATLIGGTVSQLLG